MSDYGKDGHDRIRDHNLNRLLINQEQDHEKEYWLDNE